MPPVDPLTARQSSRPAPRRLHPLLRRLIIRPPSAHPAPGVPGPFAAPAGPRLPAAPDVRFSFPTPGPGGSPGSGAQQPPPTWNHWLAGIGKQITPTPAMQAVGAAWVRLGINARQQAHYNWDHISHIHSTV